MRAYSYSVSGTGDIPIFTSESASVTTNITTLADQFKTQVKLSGVLKTARLYQKVGTTNKKVKKVGMKKKGIITLFKNL